MIFSRHVYSNKNIVENDESRKILLIYCISVIIIFLLISIYLYVKKNLYRNVEKWPSRPFYLICMTYKKYKKKFLVRIMRYIFPIKNINIFTILEQKQFIELRYDYSMLIFVSRFTNIFIE